MRFAAVFGSVLGVLVACGGSSSSPQPGKTPAGNKASCSSDADCVIVTTTTCCQACQDEPRGIPALVAEQRQNKCAVVECSSASERTQCPKVSPPGEFVAKCQEGTCSAVKR